jgi:hypothetical protein
MGECWGVFGPVDISESLSAGLAFPMLSGSNPISSITTGNAPILLKKKKKKKNHEYKA